MLEVPTDTIGTVTKFLVKVVYSITIKNELSISTWLYLLMIRNYSLMKTLVRFYQMKPIFILNVFIY